MKKVNELNDNELEAASGGAAKIELTETIRCPRCGKVTGRCRLGSYNGNLESMMCAKCRGGIIIK